MGTGLLLLAHHVNRDGRLALHALLGLGLCLLHDLTGDKVLLDDSPQRRRVVVENHACGNAPSKPGHHDGHDGTHAELLLALILGDLPGVDGHLEEGQHAKEHNEENVDEGATKAIRAEHAARVIAMQTATDNADDLIDQLTLNYNKTRQQSITNELLDIASGSISQ